MHFLLGAFLYYVAGSVVAGSLMGAGFATNLRGKPSPQQLAALQKIGEYVPLNVDGVDGGLIASPDERRPTIVYVHGRSANRMETLPLADALFREGYNAVLWDGEGRQISYGPKEIDQVRRIVATIRNDPHVDPEHIYVIGLSLGGVIAIGAASQDADRHIRAIVADSPYADLKSVASRYLTAFGVIPKPVAWIARTMTFTTAKAIHGIEFDDRNPAEWAERVACPVLLIHGTSDKRIPHTNSQQIFGQLTGEKSLWLVEGAGHTKSFAKARAEYVRRVLDFLRLT
jgi:dipeptidyl aminopeptidase/acylaminoacyl peptidase